MPDPTKARPDLIEALLASCWLVERARANVLTEWGGEFAEDGERTDRRAGIVRDVLEERDHPVPGPHLTDEHTDWIRTLCGSTPDEVPLGAAVVQRLGHWTDVYVEPFLSDGHDFAEMGEGELRFPVPPRDITREEVMLPETPIPDGPRFVILTDIHIGAAGCEELARKAVEDINRLGPEFVVCPGDITDDGEPEQFGRVKEILDGIDAPVHAVLGNHDAVRRSTTEPEGAALFAAAFGHEPADRVLEVGDLQVALVDTTDPIPSPFPDWDLARGGFRDDAGGTNNGALAPGQADALAAELDPRRPTLVVLHHELQPFGGFPPVMFGLRRQDSDALLEALAGHRVAGFVAGHTHRSYLTTAANERVETPLLEVPSLKDWPYCYTVVGVAEERAHVSVRQLSDPDLVWDRGRHVPPIYLNYVLGPRRATEHTFSL